MREFNPDANWTVSKCELALAIDRQSASKPKHTPIGAMADERHSPPVFPIEIGSCASSPWIIVLVSESERTRVPQREAFQ